MFLKFPDSTKKSEEVAAVANHVKLVIESCDRYLASGTDQDITIVVHEESVGRKAILGIKDLFAKVGTILDTVVARLAATKKKKKKRSKNKNKKSVGSEMKAGPG
ncbi:hypothetical protein EON65_51830 [archaeon]|nr:MAG: hypothetical protein EON65_51830 [archaeon]